MPENIHPAISGVAETLLITLSIRAAESRRADALIHDTRAEELVQKLDYDFDGLSKIRMDEDDRLTIILRNREFDRSVREFLTRHPDGRVIHLGCGLDTRFERVDNGSVEWYDLDLPEVIDIRRDLIGGDQPRYHLLAASAFDEGWQAELAALPSKPLLVLAEGVFMYFPAEQIRGLVLDLLNRFPGAELVCDSFSPYLVFVSNLRFRVLGPKFGVHYGWSQKDGRGLAAWDGRIHLLDACYPIELPEPRLAHLGWVQHFHFFSRVLGIYHYRLGEDVGRSSFLV